MIRISEIKVEDTYSIRKAVLREGMTLSYEMAGDHDDDTLHLGLFYNDHLVCIGSFMKASKSDFKGLQYQLRGMATEKGSQGKGYGKKLLAAAEQILKDKNVDVLWCNARVVATDFYSKLGYQSIGDVFEVDQVGRHFVMFKKLA
jgi:predicted GNAT family N-acyltransferase